MTDKHTHIINGQIYEHTHEPLHSSGHAPEHTHESAQINEHTHNHEPISEYEHPHKHSHTQTTNVLNRMSKIIGHMKSVKGMVEDGRDCTEVLIQLSAIDSAIKSVSRVILKDHMDHCIADAIESGDKKALEELNNAINMFLK